MHNVLLALLTFAESTTKHYIDSSKKLLKSCSSTNTSLITTRNYAQEGQFVTSFTWEKIKIYFYLLKNKNANSTRIQGVSTGVITTHYGAVLVHKITYCASFLSLYMHDAQSHHSTVTWVMIFFQLTTENMYILISEICKTSSK